MSQKDAARRVLGALPHEPGCNAPGTPCPETNTPLEHYAPRTLAPQSTVPLAQSSPGCFACQPLFSRNTMPPEQCAYGGCSQPRSDPEVGSGVKILFSGFHPFLKSPQNSEYFEYRHRGSNKKKFYCLGQCTSKRGCQSVRQASSQSHRNTHFGFFVSGRHGCKQWGEFLPLELEVAEW